MQLGVTDTETCDTVSHWSEAPRVSILICQPCCPLQLWSTLGLSKKEATLTQKVVFLGFFCRRG